jgi:hypothetical protein
LRVALAHHEEPLRYNYPATKQTGSRG